MKTCTKCGGLDSHYEIYYIDRNGNHFCESELEAFRILHPEAKDTKFDTVIYCGMCSFEKSMPQKIRAN